MLTRSWRHSRQLRALPASRDRQGVRRSLRGPLQDRDPARLRTHRRKKAKLWTHLSVFEVHPDATDEQIAELEGLFRHIYRRDTRANLLNKQRTHAPLKALRIQDLGAWESRQA
jgi:hypothetical protein